MRVLSVIHDATVGSGGGGLFERDRRASCGDRLDRWGVPLRPARRRRFVGVTTRSWSSAGPCTRTRTREHPLARAQRSGSSARTHWQRDVPLIGVCLGAQLIARAAGAWIGPARGAGGRLASRVGAERMRDVRRPGAGRAAAAAFEAFQWHHYTFGRPGRRALELAVELGLPSRPSVLGTAPGGSSSMPRSSATCSRRGSVRGARELGVSVEEMWAVTDRHLHTWNAHGRALCDAFLDEAKHLAA